MPKSALTRDRTMENKKAVQNPAILKPGTIFEASMINNALRTRENIPKVTTVSGKVSKVRTGLIKALIIPNTTAKTTAPKRVT